MCALSRGGDPPLGPARTRGHPASVLALAVVTSEPELTVRPRAPEDELEVQRFLAERWAADFVIARDEVHHPAALPGFVAVLGARLVGLATYTVREGACELVTLDSALERAGVGTRLLDAVTGAARAAGCARVWLVTTNDNLDALRFYQKRGFRLVAVHRGAVDRARARKPAIPALGDHGIPVHDEIELELALAPTRAGRGELELG